MTITAGAPPTKETPAGLALGFLTGGVAGVSLAAFVGGCVMGEAVPVVGGLVLPAVYGLLFFLATAPRRARAAAVAPRTALAVIEERDVLGGEGSDVPVRFELGVVPDGAPAFRVEARQEVNLVELADHRPGGVVVVEYPPDRPWAVRIVRRPTPEWEERADAAHLDTVPGPALRKPEAGGCAGGLLVVLGFLLGVGGVLLLYRAELFGGGDEGAGPRPVVVSSTTVTSSTVTVTSMSGTVSLGAGQSMLDRDELRRSVESLTQGGDGRRALTVVVQERLLTVVFAPAGVAAPGFDPRSLPFDRIPALVEEARTSLGVASPQGWQLTADGVAGPLVLRVSVTGAGGSAGTLEADGRGTVLRRNGR
ncbi:hypothetical protein ACFCX4_13155 [Kitasatospora sp. NPDC056327]|uniref:hypothetical protein n=1 Tax=Kitasatospora sp. NPDC056327 TaxID=3345785 RepID=UPI0035DF6D7C